MLDISERTLRFINECLSHSKIFIVVLSDIDLRVDGYLNTSNLILLGCVLGIVRDIQSIIIVEDIMLKQSGSIKLVADERDIFTYSFVSRRDTFTHSTASTLLPVKYGHFRELIFSEISSRLAQGQRAPVDSKITSVRMRLFCSYSHRDDRHRETLDLYLLLLQREGFISQWSDRQITPGQEWDKAIQENLEAADIILLLVSQDFLASSYAYEKEMLRAIERHDKGEARVIPVIVRPSDWHSAPFAKLQALPPAGKAVTLWKPRDQAWLAVAQGIRKAVQELRATRA
jgi:hypothetical protein